MEIPRHWRLKAQRYRLEGSTCPHCGQFMFLPRPVCSKCHFTTRLTVSWKIGAMSINDDGLRIEQPHLLLLEQAIS
jgi:hypothetical protein